MSKDAKAAIAGMACRIHEHVDSVRTYLFGSIAIGKQG
jgi:hypothetical protein